MSTRRRSGTNGALQAAISLAFVVPAAAQPAPNARPQGGQVVAGSAAIAAGGSTTTIKQTSNRAAIDWRSFDVGRDQSVVFQQPGSSSMTLNRVTGPDPSAIAGRISANGQLVLTNPSGVVFHAGAQVNAQSVIVSAPGITNQNFMAGRMMFDQHASPNARIENAGTITVREAGLAALVAPSVANSGTINAHLGHVVLAGTRAATLDLYGDGLVSIDVTKQVKRAPIGPDGREVAALVTNSGTISADGGTVQLSARAADGVVSTLVQAGGRIQANTAGGRAGQIEIAGTGGSVVIEGRVAAEGRGAGQAGGSVAIAGSVATIVASTARVSASGRAGGGTVAVGTTLARARGTGTAPAGTSARTEVAAGARISADGKAGGDGGRVTVLSTTSTSMAGAVTARGGNLGGNGGTVEVSGEGSYHLTGTVDTSAPHGALGTIVLDPRDLTITSTPNGTANQPPTNSSPNLDAGAGGTTIDAYVTPAQIEALTGNVTIQTTRDLVVASSLTYHNGSRLTLEAGRNLTVNSEVTLSAPGHFVQSGYVPGVLVLTAGSSGIVGFDPAGTLTINGFVQASGVTLSAGTGGIALSGTLSTAAISSFGFNIDTISISTTGPVVQTSGSLITGKLEGTAGSVALVGSANQIAGIGIDQNAPFQTTAGGFSVNNAVGQSLTIGTALGGGGLSVPVGQAVTIAADHLTLAAPVNAAAITATGGTVTLLPANTSRAILVSAADSSDGTALYLSPTELGHLTLGTLQLGQTAVGNGGITLGGAGEPIDLTSIGIGALALGSSGNITQGGPLTVASLSVRSGINGSIALNNSQNQIDAIPTLLGNDSIAVSTAGNLLLGTVGVDNGTISAGGSITQRGGTLSSSDGLSLVAGNLGGISLSGNSSTATSFSSIANTLSLTAGTGGVTVVSGSFKAYQLLISTAGPLTQTGGSLAATTLTGQAASVSLPSRGNALDGVNGFYVSAGDFLLVTSEPLTVTPTGGQGSLTGLTLTNGHSATLVTDYLAIGGRHGIANADLVVVAPYTAGGAVLLTSGTKPTSGLSLTTSELGLIETNALQLGGTTSAAPAAGAITIGQPGDGIIDLGAAFIPRLAFNASGAVTQNAALGVSTLAGTAASVTLTNAGNFITALDSLTAGGIAVHTSSGLTVFGPVTASGALSLSSVGLVTEQPGNVSMLLAANVSGTAVRLDASNGDGGAAGISQSAGIITAGALTGVATTLNLPQANQIGTLGDFATGGSFLVTDARALTVIGAVNSAGGALTLNARGITQTAASSITAAELDGSSSADTVLDSRLNAVSGVGTFSQTGGNFTLVTSSAQLNFGGHTGQVSATAGSLTFIADRLGVVPEPAPQTSLLAGGGPIAFSPFTALRPIDVVNLPTPQPNVLELPTLVFRLLHSDTLQLGVAGYAGPINLGTANQPLDASAFRAVELQTSGAVTQATGSVLTVASLIGQAGSISLPGSPTGYNKIAALGLAADGTGVGLAAISGPLTIGTVTDLTVHGPVSAATAITLSAQATAGLAFVGTVSAPSVTLLAGGALTQAPNSSRVVAETLSITAPSASLPSPGNRITALASQIAGDLTLDDATDLSFAIGSKVGGTLSLTVAGAVTGGPLTVQTLTGSAGTVELTAAGNQVGALGGFTTTRGFSLVDAVPLTVAGPVADPVAISLNVTGDLVLTGSLSSPQGSVRLTSSGAITQSDGTITAGTLTGRATSAALGNNNQVGRLEGFTTTGRFSLTDAVSLTVAGPVADPVGISLNVTGDLALAGSLSSPQGLVTLTSSGAITQTGGTIAAATLTGSATGSASLQQPGNSVATLGTFTTGGDFSLVDGRSLVVAGPVDPNTVSMTVRGDLVLDQSVTGGTVSLDVTGSITERGDGRIVAGTLTGRAASAALGGSNQVGTLGAFTTTGGFNLFDGVALTVAGPVADPVGISLNVSGSLALAGSLSSPTGLVTLTSSGAITQTGGTIAAGTLTGSATTAALGGSNQIGRLGAFTTAGGFNLVDGVALTVSGAVADPSSIALNVTGDLVLAGSLSSPTGLVALTSSGAIMLAGDVSAAALSLRAVDGGITQSAGVLQVAGALGVSAAGAFVQPGGSLAAGVLSGSAGSVDLGRGGATAIGEIAGLAATGVSPGTLSVMNNAPLRVSGTLSGRFLSIMAPGSLVLADGTVIRTDGQPAYAQLGSMAASPGSNLSVGSGPDGKATLTQAGTVTVVPLTAPVAVLRLDVPAAGGMVGFTDLQARSADIVLNLGSGTATGRLDAQSLTVLGARGQTDLVGTVGGRSGAQAASTSSLLPLIDLRYTLNGCVISLANCTLSSTVAVPSIFEPQAAIDSAIASAISSVLRPDILALDVLDLSVTRDRDDPTLLLPNISDKDY